MDGAPDDDRVRLKVWNLPQVEGKHQYNNMPAYLQIRQFNELAEQFKQTPFKETFGGFLFGGPCGVGKTTLGMRLAMEMDMVCIDHDEIKSKVGASCSVTRLDLHQCLLKGLELHGHPERFIFALGGDSIFRPGAENLNRLDQVNAVKEGFGLIVVVLTAEEGKLKRRFVLTKSRNPEEFKVIWNNWLNIELPYWMCCGDYFIDTSGLELSDRA